jgi:dipeptidyl aminopeptidase/acylaminoacyl peptidase
MSQPDLIPIDVLFGNPERQLPHISPDGTKLSFLAPDEGVMNVWVGTLGADDAKPVTRDRVRGILQYQWAFDGRHVLYLQDRAGDENWRLHTVDLETGDVVDRTPFDGVQARVLATSEHVPDEVLVGLNSDDPRYHDVYRLTLSTGALTKEIPNPGFDGWLVDRRLGVRGATRPRDDGGIQYLRRDGDEWNVFVDVEPDDYVLNVTHSMGFDESGTRFFMISAQGSDKGRLVAIDVDTGASTDLASDDRNDIYIAALSRTCFDPETHEPRLVPVMRERMEYIVRDASIQADVDAVRAACAGDAWFLGRDLADGKWLVMDVRDDASAAYSLYERASKSLTPLFVSQPALSKYTLARVEPFSFTSRDGLEVHAYATFPPGAGRKDLPCVLHVHGGPWGARHLWGYSPINQWIANRGYACIEVDYRGSGGYGKAFLNASAQEWAGKMHDDLIDGLEHAIAQGWIDRERMAIFGGSYGGYAALVGATFTPDVFKCAIDYVGPSNLITLLKTTPPYWFAIARQFEKLLGHPERDAEFLWSRSPLSRVDQIKIPMLIAQGANDPRVKQAESEQIVAAMEERGIEYEYLLFEDEGHGFMRPENREAFHLACERFLAKHLGGRAQDTD